MVDFPKGDYINLIMCNRAKEEYSLPPVCTIIRTLAYSLHSQAYFNLCTMFINVINNIYDKRRYK